MPYKKTKYCCRTCGEEFDSYPQAEQHELICSKCRTCQNAYYVYGTEFACKYYDLPPGSPDK